MAKDNDFSAWKPVVMETCDRYPELAVFISALLQAMFHFFHEAILQPDSRCRAFVCDTRKNEPEVVDAIVDIGEICIFDKRKVEPQLSQLRAWIKKTFPTKEPPAGAGEDQTTLWKDRVAINAAIAGMLKYLTWLCWKCEGTLAFAYHNVNGNMTGYKIRSVTDKQFSQFTIARTGEQGVFPYRYAKSLLEADTEQGAVVAANEGELNSIQVLSAQRRIGIIPPEVIPLWAHRKTTTS